MKLFLVSVILMCSLACFGANPKVMIETNMGEIEVELFEDKAPITVKNFLSYVDAKFFKDDLFYRVIDNFMIQGGGMDLKMKDKKTKAPIKNEASNGLKNDIGTIAMARTSDPQSATATFFINVKDNTSLNYPSPDGHGYAVFGKVVNGMHVVNRIKAVKTGNLNGYSDVPMDQVIIKNIARRK